MKIKLMANYFADIVAPELAEESFWKSVWDFVNPLLMPILQSWLTYVLGTSGLLVTIFLCCKSTIVTWWEYLVDYEGKVSLMGLKMYSLEVLDDKVVRRQNGVNVVEWLAKVYKVREEVAEVNSLIDQQKCDFNLFNFCSRRKVIREIISKIDSLIGEQNSEQGVDPYFEIRVQPGMASNSTETPDLYKDLDSRNSTFMKVLNAFKDDKIDRIGICGFGGVGKTTMKNQLKNAAKSMGLFHYIIDVHVGRGLDDENAQRILAEKLTCNLDNRNATGEDKRRIRNQLKERLSEQFNQLTKGSRKILVILDNMWQKLDMELLGLSELTGKKGCFKLLITTRYNYICRQMKVVEGASFKMEAMSQDEAVLLLRRLTDTTRDCEDGMRLQQTGQRIVEQCHRLPMAIKYVAESYEKSNEWDALLHTLEMGGHNATGVFNVIDESYQNLPGECKQIFLLCCFFPRNGDIPHEDLVRYVVGLRLLEGNNGMNIIMDTRARVHECIETLKSTDFLQKGEKLESVKMDDKMREFGRKHVLSDAEREPLLARALIEDTNPSTWPQTKVPYTSICFQCSSMTCIPTDFPKENLKILKLFDGSDTLVFPDNFYAGMQRLKVLVYEKIRPPLPPGLDQQDFNNLCSLSLNYLSLSDDIRMIGNLSHLEILSFAGSGIKSIPEEIRNLSRLRLLDLTDCDQELHIDEDVLGRLHNLQELYMKAHKDDSWSLQSLIGRVHSKDLINLCERLKALDFEFHGDMNVDMQLQNLKQFRISVGSFLVMEDDCYGNTLNLATTKEIIKRWKIDVLLKSTETLRLQVDDLTRISEFIDEEWIQSPMQKRSLFQDLKKLTLVGCSQLKSAFTLSLAYHYCLEKLEYLSIEDCAMLEEIVGDGSREENGRRLMGFPRLKKLCLNRLPRLAVFSKSIDVVEFPELKELELSRLPLIKRIFPESDRSSSSVQSFFNQQATMRKLEISKLHGTVDLEHGIRLCDTSPI